MMPEIPELDLIELRNAMEAVDRRVFWLGIALIIVQVVLIAHVLEISNLNRRTSWLSQDTANMGEKFHSMYDELKETINARSSTGSDTESGSAGKYGSES